MHITQIFSLLILVLLTSCKTTKEEAIKTKTEITSTLHSTFTLESIENKPYEAAMPNHPKLMLDTINEQFGGNDGCNSIFGKIEHFNATDLKLGEIAGTRIYCENTEISDQYVALLGKVRHYELIGKVLLLKDAQKNIILTFSKDAKQ